MSSFNIIDTNITEKLLLLLKLPKYIAPTNELLKTYNDTLEKVTAKVIDHLKTHQVSNTPIFDENYQILIQLFTEVKQTNHHDLQVTNEVEINFPMQPNKNKKFSDNYNYLNRLATTSAGTAIPIIRETIV